MRHVKRTANRCQVVINCTDAVAVHSYHVENATPHQTTDLQRQIFRCHLSADDDCGVILHTLHGCVVFTVIQFRDW